MPAVPAFCPSCSLVFASAFSLRNSINVTFAGNRSQCPRCGALADVADGVYDFGSDTLRVISSGHLQVS